MMKIVFKVTLKQNDIWKMLQGFLNYKVLYSGKFKWTSLVTVAKKKFMKT